METTEIIRKLRNKAQVSFDTNKRAGRKGPEWALETEAEHQAADRLSEQQQVIDELVKALESSIEGYEDGSQYKGDYLRDKHGDADDIARLRATLSRAKGHTKGAE